jgi:hypothetical protein
MLNQIGNIRSLAYIALRAMEQLGLKKSWRTGDPDWARKRRPCPHHTQFLSMDAIAPDLGEWFLPNLKVSLTLF